MDPIQEAFITTDDQNKSDELRLRLLKSAGIHANGCWSLLCYDSVATMFQSLMCVIVGCHMCLDGQSGVTHKYKQPSDQSLFCYDETLCILIDS